MTRPNVTGFCLVLPLCSSVAVGTALGSGPPHRSVREGLPRLLPRVHVTASRSLIAACPTHHKPCDSHPRLCVRRECACGAFPLVALLPFADSAANAYASTLFRGRPTPHRLACQHYGF